MAVSKQIPQNQPNSQSQIQIVETWHCFNNKLEQYFDYSLIFPSRCSKFVSSTLTIHLYYSRSWITWTSVIQNLKSEHFSRSLEFFALTYYMKFPSELLDRPSSKLFYWFKLTQFHYIRRILSLLDRYLNLFLVSMKKK
jgi:hypothetical protein